MNVLMPVADGSEEMEIVIIVDTFRRVKWNVVIAGLGEGAIRASRGVRLVPDAAWADVIPDAFDMLVIPGGGDGVAALAKDERARRGPDAEALEIAIVNLDSAIEILTE